MTARQRYFIYSPALSQSLALAALLRRARPDALLMGVLLPGEGPGGAGRAYDRIASASEAAPADGDILVPTGVESTMYLAEAKGEVALGESLLNAAALRFTDKPWSLDLAAESGVPVPATWRDVGEVERWPVFYKSAIEGEEKFRGIARTAGEVPAGNLILQEVIRGEGVHALGFLARDGEIVASHGHHEVASYPALGGSAAILARDAEPRVAAHTKALLRASGYSGWGLAEFKYCPSRDDFVFMEVNAKLWASWEMALRNEPAFARILFGIEVAPAGIDRMVFVERALRRGPLFWPTMARALLSGAMPRAYPGWPRQAAAAFTPPFLRRIARRLV